MGYPPAPAAGAPFSPFRFFFFFFFLVCLGGFFFFGGEGGCFFCCFSVGVDLGGFLDIGSQGGLFSSEWKEAVFGTREVRWGLNTFHDAKRLLLVSGQE